MEYHEHLSSSPLWVSCATIGIRNRIFEKIPIGCTAFENMLGRGGHRITLEIAEGIPMWYTSIGVLPPTSPQTLPRTCMEEKEEVEETKV